ncbi:MAG: type II toxin-antitoxin system HicA family toxin [Dysgonamonadaceae bacterium]|jgi:hypothetical protein|nr:type II toxin-antitoxin system HicA family toxin [Dysgonamonadaceae bacterium]
MSTKDKLVERFCKRPKDFTFDELVTLLKFLGFEKSNKGKTSGSRVKFNNEIMKIAIILHKPHTVGDPIKESALEEIYNHLIKNHLI